MPFFKTSVALTPSRLHPAPGNRVGEEREGKVWDGEKWVSREAWEAAEAETSQLPEGSSR